MIIQWSPGLTLESMEQMAILQAMRYFRGNKTATANALGIAVRTLDNKLEVYAEHDRRMRAVQDEQNRQAKLGYDRQRGDIPAVIGNVKGGPIFDPAVAQKERELAQASAGVRVESTIANTAEQPVPVSEHAQVQEVLQGEVAQGGKRRGRPSLYRTDEKA